MLEQDEGGEAMGAARVGCGLTVAVQGVKSKGWDGETGGTGPGQQAPEADDGQQDCPGWSRSPRGMGCRSWKAQAEVRPAPGGHGGACIRRGHLPF